MTGTLPPPDLSAVPPEVDPNGEVHRYPGSPPFADSEVDRLLFRGRAREIDEVLHSILSYDLLLVYAVSGQGKTSLLSAGVLHRLRQRDYFPVVIRLNTPGTSIVELIGTQIREAGDASDDVMVMRHPAEDGSTEEPTTLWDLLTGLEIWRGNTLQRLVLVFDQFEELFTLGWSDDERDRFIEQFGEVVRRHRSSAADGPERATDLPPPSVKITLLIREDFLGHLETLAVQVPQIMQRRFRLGGLSPDQATAAICEPASIDDPRLRSAQFTYSQGAADAILDFLRTDHGSGTTTETIDPSQLQIICQHIERSIVPRKVSAGAPIEITESDLGGKEGLDHIVGDFYRRQIESFPIRQRASLRKLCESGLISQSGRRLSLEEGEIFGAYDVSKATLAELVDRRLLRSEPRLGSVYYELAHDTLTTPILAYRDEKRRAGRRRRRIGLLAVGGLAVAVIVAIVAFNVGDAGPRYTTVTIGGRAVPGAISSAGDVARFEFDSASDDPLVVQVTPSNDLNAIVEVTDPGGFTQAGDRNGAGQAETVLLTGGGTGRYVVEVSGYRPSSGEFDVAVAQEPASTLEVGKSVSSVAGPGQIPVFGIEATGGHDLIIWVSPRGRLDPQLEVIDPDGSRSLVDDAPAGNYELVTVKDPVPGRYQLLVHAYGSSSGPFDIWVDAPDVVGVDVGDAVPARITETNGVAAFDFAAPDDGLLLVEVSAAEGLDALLTVTEPGGGQQISNAAGAGEPESILLNGGSTGRYVVIVRAMDAEPQSGGRTFELSVRSPAATPVTIGDVVTAQMGDPAAFDVFSFETTDDRPIVVSVPTGAEVLNELEIIGPSGESTWAGNAGGFYSDPTIIDGAPGTYHVVARGAVGTTGPFALSVRQVDPVAVAAGESVSGEVEGSGDVAVFEFDVLGNESVAVTVDPADPLDAILAVRGSSGAPVVADASGEGGSEQVIHLPSGAPGHYRIVVSGYGGTAGTFELSVRPFEATEVAAGDSTSASIGGPGDVAAFRFEAAAGASFAVTVEPDDGLDAIVVISDPAGDPTRVDDLAEGASEQVIRSDGEAGEYRIVVSGYDGTSGGFTLSVRPFDATELAVGDSANGAIGGTGDVAVFEFDALEGESVAVTVEPDVALNAVLTVLDPSGVPVRADASVEGESEHVIQPGAEPSHYRIVVSGYEGTAGSFALSVRPFETTELAVGDSASGAIGGLGDVAVYEFEAAPSELVAVTVDPDAALDASVTVVDPTGVSVPVDAAAEDGSERVIPSGGESGRYQVIVSGYEGTAGGFALTVRPAEETALAVGDVVSGTISGDGDAAVFQFDVDAGGPVTVAVDPDATLDAVLTLVDPSGVPVVTDVEFEGDDEQVVTSDGVTGRYQVVVSGFARTAGTFDLTVNH